MCAQIGISEGKTVGVNTASPRRWPVAVHENQASIHTADLKQPRDSTTAFRFNSTEYFGFSESVQGFTSAQTAHQTLGHFADDL